MRGPKKNYFFVNFIFFVFVCTILNSISIVKAEDNSFKPAFKPEIIITKTTETITIDGLMTESVWSTAVMVNNFSEWDPGNLTKPAVETDVYITYDNKNLYVFFKCFDEPNSIRATKSQRDQFEDNDLIGVFLDPYGDASLAYEFFVNPYGIQKDLLWLANGQEEIGFDMVWESAAQITSDGYQVEIAIPFSSLRYPNKDIQEWNVSFVRDRPRESYFIYSWAAQDKNNPCWVCQMGRIKGISDIKQERGIEFLPTFVGYQSGYLLDDNDPTSEFHNEKVDGEFSVSGKYTPSSDIVIEAAINPDFSQIEADASQIDVNSATALYYPERRPYFQEGRDLFQTKWGTFYSRTINDPQVTAKLTARLGSNSFAFLTAVDENSPYMIPFDQTNSFAYPGKSFVNVLRGLHMFGNNSQVGFMITDRRFEKNGSNSVFTIDGDTYLTEKIKTGLQFIVTHTKEPNDTSLTSHLNGLTFDKGTKTAAFDGESFNGQALVAQFRYDDRNLFLHGTYKYQSRAYRTETGFDPTINFHGGDVVGIKHFYFDKSIFEKVQLTNEMHYLWNLDGQVMNQYMQPVLKLYLRFTQTYIAVGRNFRKEYWEGKYIDDVQANILEIQMKPSNKVSTTLALTKGDGIARYVDDGEGGIGVKSDEFILGSTLNLKPIDKLTIENTYDYIQESNINTDELYFKGFIARSKFQYQANKELSMRLVLQYNDFSNSWDIDPLLTYRLNSFTVCYLGSTYDYNQYEIGSGGIKDWAMSSRQFFLKIQYLVQM